VTEARQIEAWFLNLRTSLLEGLWSSTLAAGCTCGNVSVVSHMWRKEATMGLQPSYG